MSPRPGSTLTVSFLPAGRLEGRTGCGSYLGGHSVDGEAIRLGVLSSESGDCGRRLADEAFGFTQALSVVSRWAPSETGLDLLDADGRARVRLERPGVVSPLGEWVVRRYARADGLLTALDDGPEAGLEVHLVLTGDGGATGSTGCRDFTGTFTVEADRIVIAPLTMVGLPCEGAAQRQDRRLRVLLDGAVGWRRWADTLVLTDAAGKVLLELQERPLAKPSASPSPAASGAPVDPGDAPGPSAAPAG